MRGHVQQHSCILLAAPNSEIVDTQDLYRTDRRIRRDVAKYVRTSDYTGLDQAAAGLAHFDRPTLVLWAAEDRVMPPEHGRRLAAIIPDARHLELDDTYTLMPIDQPDAVADQISSFAQSLDRQPGSHPPR